MNYIRQILYDLRQQPLVTWITLTGTALAIFLIMAVFMVNRIKVVEVSPESNRSRILYGAFIDIYFNDGSGSGSGGLAYETACEIYSNLKGIETLSFVEHWNNTAEIGVPGQQDLDVEVKNVDANFWRIYDFNFSQGVPFDSVAVDAGAKYVVITEETATRLFGKDAEAVGQEVKLNMIPYIVSGVINNANPLMPNSFAQVYKPVELKYIEPEWIVYRGPLTVVMLMRDGVTHDEVAEEVQARYVTFNNRIQKEGMTAVYHGSPYDTETMSEPFGSNRTPDIETPRRQRLITYMLLLLLPAINLSSMTRSRMRQRVAEIGVRRAFGCRRSRIVWQLLCENFFITLAGGIIGLGLSIIFVLFASNYFVNYIGSWIPDNLDQIFATPTFEMLFNWGSFGFAMLFCFLLNLLSAGIPTWKASKINPARALNSRGK